MLNDTLHCCRLFANMDSELAEAQNVMNMSTIAIESLFAK